jgi:hypothetical protein
MVNSDTGTLKEQFLYMTKYWYVVFRFEQEGEKVERKRKRKEKMM